jgi:ABC-type phosphate/phosphonate transport system substrate-binding protein
MGFGGSVDRRGILRWAGALGLGLAAVRSPSAEAEHLEAQHPEDGPAGAWPAGAGRAAAERAEGDPFVLGIFPYLPPLHIGRKFGPLAAAFAEHCAHPVSLKTKSTFPAFRQLLLDGHYDLALLHPYLYADVQPVQNYRPLGRLREDLAAVIVAREARRFERFADLRGQTLAVPPRLSAVAQLVQHELKREGLAGPDGVRLAFHRTKAACLHAVASDAAVACALPAFALDQLELFLPLALTPKFTTPAIPGLLLVAHGRLGNGYVGGLRRAVLAWGDDPSSRQLLQALGWTGLVAVRPGEYDWNRLALLVEG